MNRCKTLGPALLAVLALSVAGCGNRSAASQGGGTSSAQTQISFTVMCGEQEFNTWVKCVDLFMEKNPNIKVVMENVPGDWEGYGQKLMTLIAAGTPPDTGRIGSLQMPQYSSMGQIDELSALVSRDINMAEYDANVFEQAKVNGGLYGLPVGIYTLVVCYNKTLFDEAGIPYPSTDWNNTWTLEEFKAIARRLTKGEGPNKQYGFYANLSPERSNSFYYSEGGDVFSGDGTVSTFDQPPMVETYRWLLDMIREGYAPNMLQTTRAPPNDQLFMTNKLGMYLEGEWQIPVYAEAMEEGLRWGVAPIPRGKNGSMTVLFLDDYVVFSSSKYKEEAWKLISFLIGPEAEEIIALDQAFGMLMHLPTQERLRDRMFTSLTNEEKGVLFNSPQHAKAMYFTNNWNEMLDASMKVIDRMTMGQQNVETGLAELTVTLNELNKTNLK
ncbi:MAG: sugar ABC transporter substrate-binding protein [Treponema sp.]|jgi:multiple sugar transport system substrate-binding protein|nr:sugar ABC transporter substrate-binding protein [Treponema sp.]